jgi:apolipoprotein N-acyltransferase
VGSTAASQVGHLAVLQVLALAGMPGLSFLVSLTAATIEAALARRAPASALVGVPAAVGTALVWGTVRFRTADRRTRGASRHGAHRLDRRRSGSADRRGASPDQETLLERTTTPPRPDAQLVVWPEASNVVFPAEEPATLAEISRTASEHHIELVVAYIAPLSMEPLRYENRARWFGPDGVERLAYLKLHPVPAEPAVRGEGPALLLGHVVRTGDVGHLLRLRFPGCCAGPCPCPCGLVALPSSDWRGSIQSTHTWRRCVRSRVDFRSCDRHGFGLSAAIDAHGRLVAQQSTNDSTDPYIVASLPTIRVWTL